jgi:hypothetical protein
MALYAAENMYVYFRLAAGYDDQQIDDAMKILAAGEPVSVTRVIKPFVTEVVRLNPDGASYDIARKPPVDPPAFL